MNSLTPEIEERLARLEQRFQVLEAVRRPRYLDAGFVSDEPPAADEVLQWDDDYKKFRPQIVNGAMKTANAGYFTIPAMPVAGTGVAKSASADTWGSWVEMVASTSAALYIVGARIQNTAAATTENYISLDMATGAAGAESSIGYCVFPGNDPGADEGLRGFTVWFPHAIPVATTTRIACRTAGSSTNASSINVALLCVNQANLVAL